MNILLYGDGKCEKPQVMQRLSKNRFSSSHIRTIGVDFIQTSYTPDDGTEVAVKLWDTAGQDRKRNLTYLDLRIADGIVVMFDMTNQESFDRIRSWMKSIKRIKSEHMPRIIVGCKLDKADERVIAKDTALEVAKEFDCVYHEISATTGVGVVEMMDDICKETYEYLYPQQP